MNCNYLDLSNEIEGNNPKNSLGNLNFTEELSNDETNVVLPKRDSCFQEKAQSFINNKEEYAETIFIIKDERFDDFQNEEANNFDSDSNASKVRFFEKEIIKTVKYSYERIICDSSESFIKIINVSSVEKTVIDETYSIQNENDRINLDIECSASDNQINEIKFDSHEICTNLEATKIESNQRKNLDSCITQENATSRNIQPKKVHFHANTDCHLEAEQNSTKGRKIQNYSDLLYENIRSSESNQFDFNNCIPNESWEELLLNVSAEEEIIHSLPENEKVLPTSLNIRNIGNTINENINLINEENADLRSDSDCDISNFMNEGSVYNNNKNLKGKMNTYSQKNFSNNYKEITAVDFQNSESVTNQNSNNKMESTISDFLQKDLVEEQIGEDSCHNEKLLRNISHKLKSCQTNLKKRNIDLDYEILKLNEKRLKQSRSKYSKLENGKPKLSQILEQNRNNISRGKDFDCLSQKKESSLKRKFQVEQKTPKFKHKSEFHKKCKTEIPFGNLEEIQKFKMNKKILNQNKIKSRNQKKVIIPRHSSSLNNSYSSNARTNAMNIDILNLSEFVNDKKLFSKITILIKDCIQNSHKCKKYLVSCNANDYHNSMESNRNHIIPPFIKKETMSFNNSKNKISKTVNKNSIPRSIYKGNKNRKFQKNTTISTKSCKTQSNNNCLTTSLRDKNKKQNVCLSNNESKQNYGKNRLTNSSKYLKLGDKKLSMRCHVLLKDILKSDKKSKILRNNMIYKDIRNIDFNKKFFNSASLTDSLNKTDLKDPKLSSDCHVILHDINK